MPLAYSCSRNDVSAAVCAALPSPSSYASRWRLTSTSCASVPSRSMYTGMRQRLRFATDTGHLNGLGSAMRSAEAIGAVESVMSPVFTRPIGGMG